MKLYFPIPDLEVMHSGAWIWEGKPPTCQNSATTAVRIVDQNQLILTQLLLSVVSLAELKKIQTMLLNSLTLLNRFNHGYIMEVKISDHNNTVLLLNVVTSGSVRRRNQM